MAIDYRQQRGKTFSQLTGLLVWMLKCYVVWILMVKRKKNKARRGNNKNERSKTEKNLFFKI